jgi:formylmethanofuran dehydrogenase subunit A
LTELPFDTGDSEWAILIIQNSTNYSKAISVNVAILPGNQKVLCRLAVVQNRASVSREVSSSGESFNPTEWDATWIVKPLNQRKRLAGFGTVLFSDASVMHDNDPLIYTVAGAEAMSFINADGKVEAKASVDEINSSISVDRLYP